MAIDFRRGLKQHVNRRTMQRTEWSGIKMCNDPGVGIPFQCQVTTRRRKENATCFNLVSLRCFSYFKIRQLVQLRSVHLGVTDRHVHHHHDRNRKVWRQLRYQSFERLWSTSRNTKHNQVNCVRSGNCRFDFQCSLWGWRWQAAQWNVACSFDLFDQLIADFKDLFTR